MNSKVSIITGRVLSLLLIFFLFFDAVAKIAQVQPVMKACAEMQQPQNTIRPIGITLTVCVLLYAIPQTAILGAILLTGYLGGAVATHVRLNAPIFNIVFSVLFGVLVWLGLYLREPKLRAIIPFR